MIHFVDGRHPHEYEDLPEMTKMVADINWDVLCIIDSGRWDFYNTLFGGAEPVQSPGNSTADWIQHGVLNSDADWSDVTYVHTHKDILEMDGEKTDELSTDSRESSTERLSDVVGSVQSGITHNHNDPEKDIQMTRSFADFRAGSLPLDDTEIKGRHNPELLTKWAIETADPPMVLHYRAPELAVVGKTNLKIGQVEQNAAQQVLNDTLWNSDSVFELAKRSQISSDLVRLMYYHSYAPVVRASQKLTRYFDRVIWSADHGQGLGPMTYKNDDNNEQTRTVPFRCSWDAGLETPDAYGASEDREWRFLG